MKRIYVPILMLFFSFSLSGQSQHKTTEIEIVDVLEKRLTPILTTTHQIKHSLIRSKETSEIRSVEELFISVEVLPTQGLIKYSTDRPTLTNNLLSVFAQNPNDPNFDPGVLVLTEKDIQAIKDYQEAMGLVLGKKPEDPSRSKAWALEINPRFRMAFVFNPNNPIAWSYYQMIDGYEFDIPLAQGREYISELLALWENNQPPN